jgi:hypothetical protein
LDNAPATNVGTATYRVTPLWKNFKGQSTTITLVRKAEPKVFTLSDVVVCDGSPLNVKFESESNSATAFDWDIVDASGTQTSSVLGINPPSGSTTTGISIAKLVNKGTGVLTDRIRVTPTNGDCVGTPIYFNVTVLPEPTVNPINNVFVATGGTSPAIPFSGTATTWRWTSSNPNIYDNPNANNVLAGEGSQYPSFRAQNIIESPIESIVTVTPIYEYGNVICEGKPIVFHIIIAPKPVITAIDDVYVCNGSSTQSITPNGLPQGNGYFITWTGGSSIGLADGQGKSIPAFKAVLPSNASLNDPTVVTITVTPKILIGGVEYAGASVTFKYYVIPLAKLDTAKENAKVRDVEVCEGENVTFSIDATGYQLTYQWFKNHIAIPGATGKEYAIPAATVDATADYYAIAYGGGECKDQVQGATYHLLVKVNVIEQRWDDVLIVNCNPSQNGGYTFDKFQWYKDGSILIGETKSYIQVSGSISGHYHVVINDGAYVSCSVEFTPAPASDISVYPNPVNTGEIVTIKSTKNIVSIQLVNSTGSVVGNPPVTNKNAAEVRVPNTAGVYVIAVLLDDNSTKSFTVIVK